MLQVYDTLTKTKQEFTPLKDNKVTFYQCGPTVYSRQHIGNLSSAVRGDLIRRALIYLGYEVEFTRNITDVGHLTGENLGDAEAGEDKMAKGAKQEKTTPEKIAAKYTDLYHQDIYELNVLAPTYETVATSYVQEMAELVQELIDKGYAYANKLGIYFDVDKFPDYNRLNRQKLEENITGAGHGDVQDGEKKNPYDFALWFFKTGEHENALQTWEVEFEGIEQPVKEGFPGWHIECSAMSRSTLGPTLDIHMGGVEHIPVHHTNEIAQSEAANEEKFVNYWLHHEMLSVEGGKMSKSIGNVYSSDDLKAKGFTPLDFRYFLMQAHYRSQQNFTWEALTAARNARLKLQHKVKELFQKLPLGFDPFTERREEEYVQQFIAALQDDFNLPQALAVAWELLKTDVANEAKLVTILDFDRVLGLQLEALQNPESEFEDLPSAAQKLLQQRQQAREQKDWNTSDQLRDELQEKFGIMVKDTPQGQEIVQE